MKLDEMFKRIGSALVLLPLYLFFMTTEHFFNIPIIVLALVVSLAALYEYYQIAVVKGIRPCIVPGVIASAVIILLFYAVSFADVYRFGKIFESGKLQLFILPLLLLMTWIMVVRIFRGPIEGGITSLATTVFGVVFIPVFFGHIILLKALPDGVFYIWAIHVVVMINDTAAYFGGSWFGSHKAGIAVSPNKSWEGYFSGMLFSIISMIVIKEVYITFFDKHLFTTLEAGLLGAFLCIAGNIGDLFESAMKRDGGVKDSGRIVPGHGGMWDVFDALIFAIPLFYYYIVIKDMVIKAL